MKRRDFLKKAGMSEPPRWQRQPSMHPMCIAAKKTPIRWRMQTYAGPALAATCL
jgi:hypothetical protein